MEIIILGHRKAAAYLKQHPKQYDVIFISNPNDKFGVQTSELIPNLAKECCEILFDDVTQPIGNRIPPTEDNVRKALDFAKNRQKLIVSCQVGQSRSSAIAYSIKTMISNPEEALSILDQNIHMPNSLIVKHASNILQLPEMNKIMDNWKLQADLIQMEAGVNCC